MYVSYSYFRLLQHQIRKISTGAPLYNNISHYDSLGITPKATQADVKQAYYKLSMMYHPDKNKGSDEASKKFRDISEAYEVLGNVRLRKMYDKGLYLGRSSVAATSEDPVNKFYKSREQRTRPPPPDGKTPIYDFDEWSRSHYGATFARQQETLKRRRQDRAFNEDIINSSKTERILFAIVGLGMLYMYVAYDKREYDKDKITFFQGHSLNRKD